MGNFKSLYADILRRLKCRSKSQAHRIAHVVVDQVNHRSFERCGEAQGLAIFGQNGGDAPDRGKKSHVQHAICFVEDQHLQAAEINQSAIEEIFQASRSGDNQAGSPAQRTQLLPFGQAAYNQHRRRQFVSTNRVVLVHDLHSQLARGNQHEG